MKYTLNWCPRKKQWKLVMQRYNRSLQRNESHTTHWLSKYNAELYIQKIVLEIKPPPAKGWLRERPEFTLAGLTARHTPHQKRI